MRKIMSWLTLCILVAQCAVILFSWVVASLFPDLPLRSLLTGSGLRWLFGHITQNMSLPLLVDVMLFCIGAGAMLSSGLWHTVVHGAKSYNERMARRMAVVIALMACVTVLLLTALPHAVLLNISGTLFPSSLQPWHRSDNICHYGDYGRVLSSCSGTQPQCRLILRQSYLWHTLRSVVIAVSDDGHAAVCHVVLCLGI